MEFGYFYKQLVKGEIRDEEGEIEEEECARLLETVEKFKI